MDPQYRHTQVGWVMIAIVAAVTALVLSRLAWAGLGSWLGVFALVAGAIVLLLGSLTVEIAAGQLQVWFGPGLIRKRIALDTIVAYRAVRNPWYSGWGIRLGPYGVLWNVSGFDAVELAFGDGRRFRIGTDEPGELATAIARARGETPPAPPAFAGGRAVEPAPAGAGQRWLLMAIGLTLGLVGALFWTQTRPPTVSVSPERIEIRSLGYGTTVRAADVVSVALDPTLPRILVRTNGFAGMGSLRGHFQVEGLGAGRLFVEKGCPPYVRVALRDSFVIVNFREAERTRALYQELARAWPDRAQPPGP